MRRLRHPGVVFGIDAQGKMVVIGAMLGFVGAFFKTTLGKEAEVVDRR